MDPQLVFCCCLPAIVCTTAGHIRLFVTEEGQSAATLSQSEFPGEAVNAYRYFIHDIF
jgi:hypothetical protein